MGLQLSELLLRSCTLVHVPTALNFSCVAYNFCTVNRPEKLRGQYFFYFFRHPLSYIKKRIPKMDLSPSSGKVAALFGRVERVSCSC